MKKSIVFIFITVIIIVSVFWIKYINYQAEQRAIKEENLEYEIYLNKEITGRELTTAINRAVNNNEQNLVTKDEQGFYIDNDINSIKIQVNIIDNETTYQMETIYNGGMENFIQYYGDIYFECTQIDYNNTKKVSHIVFEQKST